MNTAFYFPWKYFLWFAPHLNKWPIRYEPTVTTAGTSCRNDVHTSGLATWNCSSPANQSSCVLVWFMGCSCIPAGFAGCSCSCVNKGRAGL